MKSMSQPDWALCNSSRIKALARKCQKNRSEKSSKRINPQTSLKPNQNLKQKYKTPHKTHNNPKTQQSTAAEN